MIEARGLSKRCGGKVAIDDLSFTVRPGHVTGFLGPNGAGETTTMRMILGLDRPTAESVTGEGALIRHTAGAITAILGVLFLLPLLGQALPSSWYNEIVQWLPSATALGPITSSAPPPPAVAPHLYSAWGEFAVFCGYAAVLVAAGAWSFLRRDA